MKRVIKTIPSEISIAPPGTVLYGGYMDYLTESDAPQEAIYVAEMKGERIEVLKDAPIAFDFIHDFAGWKDDKRK